MPPDSLVLNAIALALSAGAPYSHNHDAFLVVPRIQGSHVISKPKSGAAVLPIHVLSKSRSERRRRLSLKSYSRVSSLPTTSSGADRIHLTSI